MREDTVPVVQQGISTSLQMLASLLLLIGSACLVPTAGAQTYTIIHNFTNGGDGATPQAGLTMDAGGNFCDIHHTSLVERSGNIPVGNVAVPGGGLRQQYST